MIYKVRLILSRMDQRGLSGIRGDRHLPYSWSLLSLLSCLFCLSLLSFGLQASVVITHPGQSYYGESHGDEKNTT